MTMTGSLKLVCVLVGLTFVLLPALTLKPAAQANVMTTHDELPVSDLVVDSCVEPIILQGRFHVVTHVTSDQSGGFHMEAHMNAQHIRGFGAATGTIYHAPLAEVFAVETSGPPPLEVTQEVHFDLISQGVMPNLIAHTLLHVTINANGEATAEVLDTRIECRGSSDAAQDDPTP